MNLGGGTNLCVSTRDEDEVDDTAEEMCCSAWSDSIFELPI